MPDRQALLWKAISLGVGAGAGFAAERLVSMAWQAIFPTDPPTNPADRRNSWPETIAWATAVGIGAGLARAVANRSASAVWEAATDETPPGVPDN